MYYLPQTNKPKKVVRIITSPESRWGLEKEGKLLNSYPFTKSLLDPRRLFYLVGPRSPKGVTSLWCEFYYGQHGRNLTKRTGTQS